MISAAGRLHVTTQMSKKVTTSPESFLPIGSRVLCIPAGAYRDELAGEMLAQLLRNQGFEAENLPARLKDDELIDRTVEVQPECICVSVLPPTSIAQARHLRFGNS